MLFRRCCFAIILLCPVAAVQAQHRVDSRNTYERVYAVVPWVGANSKADPKRPMFAPTPVQRDPASRAGILAFQCIASDNGALALCEFVAKDRGALNAVLNTPGIKAFLKGRDKADDVVAEFSKHVKNFDINRFGVFVP